jgi:pimeloyl-ACP methyl ester carboxylesterase
MLARLLPLAACALALVVADSALAAWPGTPGKVAYFDRAKDSDFPLRVWTPNLGTGSEITVDATNYHVQDDPADTVPYTTGFPSAPAWSPDGTRLAYASKIDDGSLAPGATKTAIFVWTLKTGAIQQITTPPAGKPDPNADNVQEGYAWADYSPAWSPDGTMIAFVRFHTAGDDEPVYATRGGHVHTVPASGGAPTQITFQVPHLFTGLAWGGDPAPGGQTKLVGYQVRENLPPQVVTIDPSSGSLSPVLSGTNAALVQDFDVNPDGLGISHSDADLQLRTTAFGGGTTALGQHTGSFNLRASPTGNGPLHNGLTMIPGVGQRGGIVERRIPDASGDVWPEDPADRWVNGLLNVNGPTNDQYAQNTVGRSLWDIQPQRLPIINIPGFAGSDILCGGETLWPPGPTGNGARLQQMRLDPDGKTNLCAGAGPTADPDDPEGFVSSVFGSDIYEPQEDFIEDIAPGPRGYQLSWDWRKGPGESILRLNTLINDILASDFATEQGVKQVVLYGHSYGGLLMREYLNVHPQKVGRALTVGTPFWGAAKPLYFVAAGVENPLSGVADLDSFLPNEDAKAWARDSSGLYHLFASDNFGPWLRVGQDLQDQAGVRNWFTTVGGGNGALIDQARAWHAANDGFYTAQGVVDTRAVISTGLLTINGVDVAPAPAADGSLDTLIRLGDGDITVPAKSAHQGPVGTHTPLGMPVHVQAVCKVPHMEMGGDVKITQPYTEYLLRGRTPRKTEGACKASGFGVKIAKIDLTPTRRRAAAVETPALTLEQAESAGKIQYIEMPKFPLAVFDDANPVNVQLAGSGERVTLTVTRYDDGAAGQTRTYSGLTGPVTMATGSAGESTVMANGVAVAPDTGTPPGDGGGGGGGGTTTPPGGGGTTPPTGGTTPPGGSTPTPGRTAAGLRLRSAKVSKGTLKVELGIAAPATGTVTVRATAGKAKLTFKVRLSGKSKVSAAKKLPAKLRRARRFKLTAAYAGDASYLPGEVSRTIKR